MKKGKLIIYWDYELKTGLDLSKIRKGDGTEDFKQSSFILKILKKKEIKTCFAVLGITCENGPLPYHAPEQIKQMVEDGHEVGSHTYNHERISTLSYQELKNTLLQSKEKIERITKKKCVSFVPPWNKPQYLFNSAIDFYPGTVIPRKSKLTKKQICLALKETGYQNYRVCPLTSRFNKFKLSTPYTFENILCIPNRLNNGFGINAKKIIDKAVKNKGLAVLYAHPQGLGLPGLENRTHFIRIMEYINKLEKNHKLESVLPANLKEHI